MILQRGIAVLAAIFLLFPSTSQAGQYDAEMLGDSLPMWMETLASINDHGDVAWTRWDGSAGNAATHAEFRGDGVAITLPNNYNSSWAVGLGEPKIDGSFTYIGVAGSWASSQRLTDRSAVLWDVRWATNNSPSATATALDLGAATPKLEGPADATVQQSAAYAVIPTPQGGANAYYVGGFARDRVANAVLPQPVIWTVNHAMAPSPTITREPLVRLDGSKAVGTGSGYVSSIVHNDEKNQIWACGNSTSATAYNQATCWNITSGVANATTHTPLTTALQSAAGGQTVVSSMVHRVRVVPTGPNGAKHTVAVGASLIGAVGNAMWKGWVYDIDANVLYDDLGLTSSNHETFAYDVAGLSYQNGTPTPSKGMIIAGISSSVSSGPLGGLSDGITPSAQAMRGVHHRQLISGISDQGKVCAIQDDSTDLSGNYEQLLALSSDGTYRLALNEGKLVRLTAFPTEATVEIQNRDATRRARTRQGRSPEQYYHVKAQLTQPAQAAVLRLGTAIGCDVVSSIGSGLGSTLCDTDAPASFDIDAAHAIDLVQSGIIQVGVGSTTAVSAKQPGSLFTAAPYTYAQIAQRSGTDCTLTPVVSAASVNVQTPLGTSNGQTSADIVGTQNWTWCGSDKWVDPKEDVNHCATCNNAVQTLTCADTMCDDGIPEVDVVDNGRCAIGAANNWACKNDGQVSDQNTMLSIMKNHSATHCGNATNQPVVNSCSRCVSNTNDRDWTTLTNTPCCDGSGNPILDVYDRTFTNASSRGSCTSSSNSLGIDKNSGYARHAWWVDPRNLSSSGGQESWKTYTQGSYWSKNSQCEASTSTVEPQNLSKASDGSGNTPPRRIRATFTPGIDETDWYGVVYDDSPNNATTPKPRGRLISQSDNPNTGAKVRMEMCIYVDCFEKNQMHVDIKHLFFRSTGQGRFYPQKDLNSTPTRMGLGTFRPQNPNWGGWGGQIAHRWMFEPNNPSNAWVTARVHATGQEMYLYTGNYALGPDVNSPAWDARGPCFETNDAGILDMTIFDYDCTDTDKEEAWVFFKVGLVDEGLEDLTCQDVKYTLFYGNDRDTEKNQSAALTPSHDSGYHPGCDSCCHDTW